jgi:predicted ATPase with chaperone activity
MYTEGNPSSVITTDLQKEFRAPTHTEEEIKPTESRQGRRFCPPIPQTLEATGLPNSLVEQLILKLLYFKGDAVAHDLCRAAGLIFNAVEDTIEWFKHQQLIQVKSSLGYGPISATLALTESGRRVARDYLENNQYVGPAPVPVAEYAAGVQAQKLPERWLTPERLAMAYSHMTIKDSLLDQIGPAVGAGKSFLIYGQPGNGKTYLAEALVRVKTSDIFVPYALEYQGNIIQLYDPVYHERTAGDEDAESGAFRELSHDGRWVRCRRPFIATGGELSL